LEHIIVSGEAHLRQILQSYARYTNIRTHRSLDKDAPVTRQKPGIRRREFVALKIARRAMESCGTYQPAASCWWRTRMERDMSHVTLCRTRASF
jgi:hypothetical protein